MFRIALKSILGRKARLVLTSLAVILGTAFLSGTSVFSATLNRTFNVLFQDVFRNVDSYVRSSEVIEGDFGQEERQRISADIVDIVKKVPGVSDAVPDIQAFARIIGKDGKPLGSEGNGPPTFGSIGVPFEGQLWTVAEGSFPTNSGQVALDEASAEKAGYVLGDKVKIVAQSGSREFTLSGIASYGDVRSPGGATFALFDPATASEFLIGKPGYIDAVLVAGDDSVSDEELSARIRAAIPNSYKTETLTGAEITKETQDQIGTALSFFGILLTVFSAIALGVGSFVIYNVFSISAAQRERENALLRAIGASRKQITRAMLTESVAVGLVGSVAGLVGGIGLTVGLSAMLRALGVDLPTGGLVVTTNTVFTTILVGLFVTVASAWMPARRAGKVPPLAAMRASALETAGPTRTRAIVAFSAIAAGAGLIAAVMGGLSATWLGLGVVLVFVGAIVLGPVLARPVAMFLGKPAAVVRGVTGSMARENAARNPKRTARTASPVLIGVALVTAVSALAASIQGQINDIFAAQLKSDFVVRVSARGFGGLSPSFAQELNDIDGVQAATGIGAVLVRIDGKGRYLTVVTPSTVGDNYDIGLIGAKYGDLDAKGIFLSKSYADTNGYRVGSTINATLPDASEHSLTVRGLYQNDDLAGRYVISRALLEGTTVTSFDFGAYIKLKDGADTAAVRQELQKAVDDYGQGELLSRQEYIDKQAGQVNQLLGLIYGLLALSVIIAIVGIVITLLLSVFERQREIGLLRAVGMTRSQVRTTVRWESVITSLIGAVTGIVLGIGLGWVIVLALRDQGLTAFHVPVGTTVTILVMSFVVGVFAAVYPAWRATKVDVLEALTTT